MSTNITKIINIISKFLDSSVVKTKNLKQLEDVLKLPIYSYKFLEKSEAKILKELLDVSNIEEASKLDKENPFERLENIESTKDPIKAAEVQEELYEKLETLVKQNPDLEKNLKKAITISSIIANIKEDQAGFEKVAQKIVVVGLDNAGKTAILTKFGGKLGIADLATLKPTKAVERHLIKTEDSELDLLIWDMGGQLEYRNKYLEYPERFFLQSDLLIYTLPRFHNTVKNYQKQTRYHHQMHHLLHPVSYYNSLVHHHLHITYFH